MLAETSSGDKVGHVLSESGLERALSDTVPFKHACFNLPTCRGGMEAVPPHLHPLRGLWPRQRCVSTLAPTGSADAGLDTARQMSKVPAACRSPPTWPACMPSRWRLGDLRMVVFGANFTAPLLAGLTCRATLLSPWRRMSPRQ